MNTLQVGPNVSVCYDGATVLIHVCNNRFSEYLSPDMVQGWVDKGAAIDLTTEEIGGREMLVVTDPEFSGISLDFDVTSAVEVTTGDLKKALEVARYTKEVIATAKTTK